MTSNQQYPVRQYRTGTFHRSIAQLGACFAFACFVLVPAFQAVGAYLESDAGPLDRSSETEPPRRIIRPAPVPEPENPVVQLIRRLEVDKPEQYRDIMVFPLVLRGSESTGIRTLDEALSRNWITIREKDTAQVSEILIRNDAKYQVFLMSGEIIAGGRQNRIIRDDVLLPPASDFLSVPVYCGEKERWAGPRETFSSAPAMADHGIRKMAAGAEPQGNIWKEIDEKLEAAKVKAPTRNYQQIYEDRAVTRQLDKAVAEFRRIPRRNTVGAVVVSGDRIVCCDVFSDPELCSRLWDKICRSYVMESVLRIGDLEERDARVRERWHSHVDQDDVRRALNLALQARFTPDHTPGDGQRFRISGTVEGNALTWRNIVVHAVLFPDTVRPMPMPLRGER